MSRRRRSQTIRVVSKKHALPIRRTLAWVRPCSASAGTIRVRQEPPPSHVVAARGRFFKPWARGGAVLGDGSSPGIHCADAGLGEREPGVRSLPIPAQSLSRIALRRGRRDRCCRSSLLRRRYPGRQPSCTTSSLRHSRGPRQAVGAHPWGLHYAPRDNKNGGFSKLLSQIRSRISIRLELAGEQREDD